MVSTQTAEDFELQAAATPVAWLAVDDEDMTQSELQELVTNVIVEADVSAQDVNSPLMQRAVYQQVIDAVMLTVIGLLSISVVIAFVGVANTLSLSTLERTRENSLMRALGLTKGGLRSMLIWEAILISAIGAILGSALGMLYGWAGSTAIFAQLSPDGVEMSWPWLETAVVVLIAISAGLLASLAPTPGVEIVSGAGTGHRFRTRQCNSALPAGSATLKIQREATTLKPRQIRTLPGPHQARTLAPAFHCQTSPRRPQH